MVPRVQATIAGLTEERARVERFARSLTAEELVRPVPGTGWTVSDFVAHVFDVDRFNESAVSARRGRSVEDNLAEGASLRDRLVAVIERFTDDTLDSVIRFGGDRKRPPVDLPLGQFLMSWTRHDAIHVADMLKALPERRHDPEIVAWLGRPEVAASISAYQKAMG